MNAKPLKAVSCPVLQDTEQSRQRARAQLYDCVGVPLSRSPVEVPLLLVTDIRFDCDLTFDEPSETWTLHSVALLHPTPIREVMGQKVQFSYPGPGLNKWQALLLQLWFVLC
ncbi:hypothetical protein SLEP1_g11647 [Rubroshorea leprosula]|nr:hypothetical protein SLEP1_g11647 [Rubroshorea leprosula]